MNKKFLLAGVATVALSLTGTLVVNAMGKEVVITFSDGKKVVSRGFHDTVAEALEDEGFKMAEMKQKYLPSIPWDQKLTQDLTNVSLNCRCKISLTIGGKAEGEKETAKGTVREFLEEQKIALGEWDEISTALDAKIQDGMQISIDRIEQVVKKEEKEIKFDTEEQKDKTLAKGEKKEVTAGKLGKEIYQVTIYYKNGQPMMKDGKPASDSKLIEKIDPIKAVVKIGTKEEAEESDSRPASAGGGSLPNGTSYKKMMTAETTAYTSKPGAKTASGKVARVGLVAVDPRVIPLGTRLFIEDYGMAVAADTGGAVKGNIIDVYFNSEAECQKWGRKNKKVYILD
ncbi:3D (Asp-Asp-Asp) domain-containing protein/uncharacterized protein YabE (DUF348 family) [Croceifilum oryzae]|uniref:3D (Asp-Asp-Asp) domain-containing protein/uncharacterized protein YabE (DUF348 family) n=1 Tax=Croceifilum oryzae TaxID=1553429 RepID=A0AAJ1TGV9_9BACL|nr:3D domain-containing protein [Croceifilum oryzae]MDQ0416312.1 3D (Asp-Asp-Asp) domain-containing protein/uncharacterized protein YabE (DUF348 family) [Croceifilum oryzae]